MAPDGFLMALGEFSVASAGISIESWLTSGTGEIARAIGTIGTKCHSHKVESDWPLGACEGDTGEILLCPPNPK